MKKYFTSLFFTFFIFNGAVFSQTIDFPINNAVWKEVQTTIAGPITQYLALCGDTVINDISYSRLVMLQVDSQLQVTDSYYQGGLRQENDLVYFIYDGAPNELLLFDFSLEAGDEISLLIFGTVTTRKVDSTNVRLLAGQMRKVIYFEKNPNCYEPPEFWIESIGSSYGLLTRGLDPCSVSDAGGQLLCYEHEDEYLNLTLIECFLPELNNCNLTNATDDVLKKQLEIIISPNPSYGHILIDIKNKEIGRNWSVSFLNAVGEMAAVEINRDGNKFESNIAHLPSGIYFIKIINEKNTIMGVGKFLKI